MAANNAYRQREAEVPVKRIPVQEFPPPRTNVNGLDMSGASSGIHSLVEKLHGGLEVFNGMSCQLFDCS